MTATPTAAELRNRLVNEITTHRPLPKNVEDALRTVHREAHLPGIDLPTAYSDQAISIKDNPSGPLPLSCASVPSVVATMLDQLDVQPGDNVLEIGAGTGYNAALLAELTGPHGQITTIDIDTDVALHARTTLNQAGYEHVHVIHRDGLLGAPEHAPYTRVIATVGVWDIPHTWWHQLADSGRLVLPLRWRGQARSVALTRHGDRLVSDSMELCGFVPIIGQDGEQTTALGTGDTVRIHHDQDQPVDPTALARNLFATPCTESWSDVRIGGEESFDGIWLRATATDDRVCRIEVTPTALDHGIRRPAIPVRSPALVAGDSVAYLINQREGANPERPFRLGAAAYGPTGVALARDLITHIEAWDRERTATPDLVIFPSSPQSSSGSEQSIRKPESRLELTY
ncbi:methyltransferase, FxLD system [Streptomyces sp. LHD-70]|uniref:methyltransferase, FxLD system n=1 Tax=Streptomyces sp. LHD-70 TaxID=3072140 RepID=UPI00280C6EB9|nr:methyltransferase, FxLD system [Streptomyces sp. LHD-70]MDQ8708228.1 methyltransferase, FxLD system [Streptomyces sp. LHD-70]